MVKQSSVVQKAEIVVEYAKYTEMSTGRIMKNGVEAIKRHNGMGNNAALTAAGLADGWNIKFTTQPAQSPDLNLILDLGFFRRSKVVLQQ